MRFYSTVLPVHKKQEVHAVHEAEKPKSPLQAIPENEAFTEIRERPVVRDRAPAPRGLEHLLKAKANGLSILH